MKNEIDEEKITTSFLAEQYTWWFLWWYQVVFKGILPVNHFNSKFGDENNVSTYEASPVMISFIKK